MELTTPNGIKINAIGWEPCSEGCLGWVHSNFPYEIQACDSCARFRASLTSTETRDDLAAIAHREECGCTWPEIDLQSAAMSWMQSLIPENSLATADIERLELLLDCRDAEFMDNLTPAIQLCTNLIDKTKGEEKSTLGGLMRCLKMARDGIEKEELKLKDFGEPPMPIVASIKKEMTKEEIIKAVSERYKNLDLIADHVFAAATSLAHRTNTDGLDSQIDFLVERWGLEFTRQRLLNDFQCDDPNCPDAKENPYHDHPKED